MLERMTDDKISSIVKSAIDSATDFIETEIAPSRMKADRYFDGDVDLEAEEGRSTAVSTKCSDVVRAVKPSLMRVFLSTDKPVEFLPKGEEDTAAAEQATEYVNWTFNRSNGFKVISDVFHDALVKKVGIAKVYHKDVDEQEVRTINNVPDEVFASFVMPDNVEVLEHTQNEDGTHDAKITITNTKGEIVIESIPPEEFFIDSDARDLDRFYICGHRKEGRIADLLEMGFSYDDVEGLDADEEEEEEFDRDGIMSETDEASLDPAMRVVTITEAYMQMDVEGTGKPSLWCFICGGSQNKVLEKYLVEEVPFAVFEVDPEPHTFFGRSLVDIVIQDQTVATSLLRGMIDNVHLSNNPGFVLNEDKVSDAGEWTTGEIGGIKRVQGSPADAVMPLIVPSQAMAVLPVSQYYDVLVEQKSGITRASAGLDPAVLQSATATAVDATIRGANEQKEIIARNLAEGMKQLFRLLLRLSHRHADQATMMRLNGVFVPVDPASWNVDMDMSVNVGLGSGNEDAKRMVLREVLQRQEGYYMQGGPDNGLVSLTNIRNTIADILSLEGYLNADRYFAPMDPQREQAMQQQKAQQAQQQQPPQPDPTYVTVEQIKAQAAMQKAQIDAQVKVEIERMRDDRERDKQETDDIFRSAEWLKDGMPVDPAAIDYARNKPR